MIFVKDGEYRVDRIEDGLAFLEAEDGSVVSVRAEELPPEIKEGKVCKICGGAFICDEARTTELRKKFFNLAHKLAEKD